MDATLEPAAIRYRRAPWHACLRAGIKRMRQPPSDDRQQRSGIRGNAEPGDLWNRNCGSDCLDEHYAEKRDTVFSYHFSDDDQRQRVFYRGWEQPASHSGFRRNI